MAASTSASATMGNRIESSFLSHDNKAIRGDVGVSSVSPRARPLPRCRRIARQGWGRVDPGAGGQRGCGSRSEDLDVPRCCDGAALLSRVLRHASMRSNPGGNFRSQRGTHQRSRQYHRWLRRPRRRPDACAHGGPSASSPRRWLRARSMAPPNPRLAGTAPQTKGTHKAKLAFCNLTSEPYLSSQH